MARIPRERLVAQVSAFSQADSDVTTAVGLLLHQSKREGGCFMRENDTKVIASMQREFLVYKDFQRFSVS